MLDIIFLSIVFVNIVKIIFFSFDILCNGFKEKKIIYKFYDFFFCIGN